MSKKQAEAKVNDQKNEVEQLLADLQRTRADFENYRKNIDARVAMARNDGREEAIKKLLPIIDDIDRATSYLPADLAENDWAQGVAGLNKKVLAMLAEIGVQKIPAKAGTKFNPDIHNAVQFSDSAEGETEIIEEELQPGYILGDQVLRPSMVRVTRG